ncbi:MAG TPA: CUAEP/CCAEP-tail radical SAM protein [Polyangia bacterium]|nr:CUAEP/CCAEP-tail radical SAM protein [Polyangia bacterium]
MRGPGDILLVSCYEPGHQPAGVASAVAFLRRAGFAPTCLDLAVEPLDDRARARLNAARLVALSVPMHTALTLGLRVAERVRRENPHAHLCFFGLYAVLNQALLMERADTVLPPDCDETLVALAGALETGSRLPSGPAPGRMPAPRRLPVIAPARDALPPLDRYARLAIGDERRVAGHVEATRGCKHLCRHCPLPPVYKGRFFAVPVEAVLADVGVQVAAGARHIDFGDPDFLNGPKHALRVARALHAAHPEVTFSFTAKVEHILKHRAFFPELAALGAVFVVSAFESLSEEVLAALDKGHRAADLPEALAIVRGAGISLRPTFVPFTPWTTLADYLALCRFIRAEALENEVDPVQFSLRLLIPPGSLLLELPDLVRRLGPLDAGALTYRWTHIDPRLARLETDVAALVEEATRGEGAAAETFARIHALAAAAGGASVGDDRGFHASAATPPPPHLTEPWFCCAAPTRRQLGAV